MKQFETLCGHSTYHKRHFSRSIGSVQPCNPPRLGRHRRSADMDKVSSLGYNVRTWFGVPRAVALPTPSQARQAEVVELVDTQR